MRSIWRFLAKPANLAVIAALGAAIAFLWKDVIAPMVIKPPAAETNATVAADPPAVINQNAIADNGTAVAATGNAQVSIGAPADPE